MKRTALILCMIVLFPTISRAQQQKSTLVIKTRAEVEVITTTAQGAKEVKRVEAVKSSVGPGDSVLFTSTYTNTAGLPAADIVIANPIPEHMRYVDRSAEGRGTRIEFSADNGRTFGEPGGVTVKDANGTVRKALAGEYTHVRWTLLAPLAAGASGTVSFRAKVE